MPKECWVLQDKLKNNIELFGRSNTNYNTGFRPGLLEICQELHEYTTGSSDVLDFDHKTRDLIVKILETAVDNWEPASPKVSWKDYDDAVLNIVKITLKEYHERNTL
jgi:hypothetical protein